MKTALAILVLGGLALVTLLTTLSVLEGIGEVDLGFHGSLALTLGIVFTALVGGGLMFLVFRSARSGHDDVAGGTMARDDGED